MADDILVSIVIVNYNAGAYLPRCLESIYAQTCQRFEIFIIDNASTDGSLAQIARNSRLTIQRNARNLGFARAQNQGFRMARGRYVMPLNFDIRMSPTFLEEMVAAMETGSRTGTVSGKLLQMVKGGDQTGYIDNAGILLPRNRFPRHRGGGEADRGQYEGVVKVFGAMGAAALYRREMLEDIAFQGEYFDESFFMWYEDIDLDWRARLRGWDCVYAPRAVAYHVGDPHGHGKSPFGAKTSMRNRWMMILSNEGAGCLARNAGALALEELKLLRYVLRFGLLGAYAAALASLARNLPGVLRKRKWVQSRAALRCLPDFPLAYH